ncbi:hypothetical protein [Arthrobacter sp. NIO-1057]|uniref:hypothetical protein n=1 Tax=Arthrobacter sp. NIO-1057 TaxID=993071 RepID=UPI001E62CE4D|nr:hypothetical protein [Arthrobacter sp. NIO-1057]
MAVIAETLPAQSSVARDEVHQVLDAPRAQSIRAAYTTRFVAAEVQRNPPRLSDRLPGIYGFFSRGCGDREGERAR